MSSIVAGRFASIPEAEQAAQKLYARGFSVWDVSIMSVDPGGARPPGVLLAARAKGERRDEVLEVLREGGACDCEQAKGKWEGGQWTDFDPARAPALVDAAEGNAGPSRDRAPSTVQGRAQARVPTAMGGRPTPHRWPRKRWQRTVPATRTLAASSSITSTARSPATTDLW
ncbi:hypothetical protein [Cupriavidus sp. EM10]|uniref:hypothetical protein n=1 Tax=Cupriavidus sp. EM10 TaxID=2839983 RepID=UPI001CEE05C1|nr:hypothetical protein [Cupriavidus sp. EM10]